MTDEMKDYTPKELDRIINGEELEGDTESNADAAGDNSNAEVEPEEKASLPEAGSNDGASPQESNEPSEPELTPDNAVILAKDGKHTIDYQKLLDARQQAQEAKAEAEAARLELDRLKAEAQARAEAGAQPTAVDNQANIAQQAIDSGVDPELFGDFSEEALAKGINALVQQQVQSQMQQALAPIAEKEQQSELEQHYQQIYTAHPDADSLIESQELADWMNQQTSIVQSAYAQVLQHGSAQQIIEVFDAFKSANQPAAASDNTNQVKAAAQKAIENAANQPPTSLTDLAGGRAVGNQADAMADMDGVALLSQMDGMSPEQIEQFLNRL